MCILICRIGERPLVAANRDEAYARPFTAPRVWVADTPFWAPRDEEEGGTWIGVNREGLVAAITNRSTLPETAGRASRGLLVAGALAKGSFDRACGWLGEDLAHAPRNPCQVVVFQGVRGRLFRVGPEGTEARDLAPGLHVLSNLHEPGELDFGLSPDPSWDDLRAVLADTAPRLPRGYAVCKRAGWRGTVASTFIEPHRRFLFAGGPPDVVEFEPVAGYP
ncbi:MAG TPA: NRDE family protein [Planctomycetota bacterium]|nr:NRDE family protein [Planctomycetota bacterium]